MITTQQFVLNSVVCDIVRIARSIVCRSNPSTWTTKEA
jgi:hypothetical protein